MTLAAGRKMDAGELAMERKLQLWRMNLREMEIDFSPSPDSGDMSLVDHWKLQPHGKAGVDTTDGRARIDQGRDPRHL